MNIGKQTYPFVFSSLRGKGKTSIGTTATKISFDIRPSLVVITADPSNTGILYYGDSTITYLGDYAAGYLNAGDSISLNFDTTDGNLYLVSSVASQNYWSGAYK